MVLIPYQDKEDTKAAGEKITDKGYPKQEMQLNCLVA